MSEATTEYPQDHAEPPPPTYCPDCGSKLEEVDILHPVIGYEVELLCPNRCGETR